MRLFRRRQDAPPPPPETPEASGPDGEDVARPDTAPVGDWMTVPPMPATVRPMPPTFRVQTLPEILTSHQSVRLSGNLGHSVSPEAPSGSVQGLTVTNPGVQAVAGHGDLPLRTPHPPEPVTVQPLVVRRLASSDPPAVEPVQAAALPAPAVSRVLAAPAPRPGPPTAPLPVARVVDTPTATPSPAAPAAAPPSAEDAASDPAPTASAAGAQAPGAPLVGDDRVGGFAVDLQALTEPTSTAELRRPAPTELDPPIQPRTLQRRVSPSNGPVQRSAAPGAGTAPAAPVTPQAAMPLAGGGAPVSAAGPAPGGGGPAGGGAGPGPALDDVAVDMPATGASEAVAPSGTLGGTTSGSAGPPGSGDTTAVGPGVDGAGQPGGNSSQPAAEPATDPPTLQRAPLVGESSLASTEPDSPPGPAGEAAGALVLRTPAGPADAVDAAGRVPTTASDQARPLAGDAGAVSSSSAWAADESPDASPSRDGAAPAPRADLPLHRPPGPSRESEALPAVQRAADSSGGSSVASGPGVTAASVSPGTVEAAVTAPLAGERPLGPPGPAAVANDPSPSGAVHQDLPLVVPGAGKEPAGQAPPAATARPGTIEAEPAGGEAEPAGGEAASAGAPAPPLAADPPPDGPVVVPTLGVGDAGLAVQTSSDAGSPLAQPAAASPAGIAQLPLAPLEQPGTLGAPASAGPSARASGSVLTRPSAAGSASRSGPIATGTASLQRLAPTNGTSTGTAAPLQTTLQLAAPAAATATATAAQLGSSAPGAVSRPLQQVASGALAATAATGSAPTASQGSAPPIVLRRLPTMAAGAGAGSQATTLQRVTNGAAASTDGAAGSSSFSPSRGAEPLPLHTPAASVPTAADVAVRAGLAERQADGTLLYSSPPAGSDASEAPVQRVLATAPPASTPPADATTGVAPASPAAGADAKGAGGGGGQTPEELDLLARRLYKRLRSEMQADIAKQLEAKNRAGRYRR